MAEESSLGWLAGGLKLILKEILLALAGLLASLFIGSEVITLDQRELSIRVKLFGVGSVSRFSLHHSVPRQGGLEYAIKLIQNYQARSESTH